MKSERYVYRRTRGTTTMLGVKGRMKAWEFWLQGEEKKRGEARLPKARRVTREFLPVGRVAETSEEEGPRKISRVFRPKRGEEGIQLRTKGRGL